MTFEEVVNIAEKRGFFWPSSEIYSSRFAGFIDYGPNGVSMKNNFIRLWRETFRNCMIEIDGCQLMPKDVFRASGHLENFSDPIVFCTKCKSQFRADQLISEKTPEGLKNKEYDQLIMKKKIVCSKCKGKLSETTRHNLMFKTGVGAENKEAYFRPETCQSIFVSFQRIFKTLRAKLPFGVGQIGKCFRNEISPRQSLNRVREINQAEFELFFNPEKENDFKVSGLKLNLFVGNKLQKISSKEALKKKIISSALIAHYLELVQKFYLKLGFDLSKLRFRKVGDNDRAFYSRETWDLEVSTSIGWVELGCLNHRFEHDLGSHADVSGAKLMVLDESTGKKVLPNVFEISLGIDRPILSLLDTSFVEEKKNDRTFFKLNFDMAPIQVAVFPLVSKDKLPAKAKKVFELVSNFRAFYDESGSIGKRYRRMDEIGCPYCLTIDHQTLKDNTVTVRERDSMKQKRVKIDKLDSLWKS
ncbi:MAG: glycine--tRNA ligase [archaeon]